ncbi:MAG: HD domain-containing protein [Methylobacter sp.]
MTKIEFPTRLKNLIESSPLQAPIRAYADHVGVILADNKLPFFPDYTDHGTDHINQVLETEVDLVPEAVWDNSTKSSKPQLLCDADAVIIIGATLLHDIAMHLYPDGFLELVGDNSRFQPLTWFKDTQEGYSADRPWRELWLDFEREARRFSDRDLGNIIGLESVRQGWKFEKLSEDTGQWERNHCLIIGEFIRRHHARLAHEIALYGFPGLEAGSGNGQFPALGEQGHHLQHLADLIGLSARSHGLSLRICQAYLKASPSHTGSLRPMGSAVLYPMALLRVADYLQIDGQRAPAVLLKLRNPQSPVSVQEWKKHRAIQSIGPHNDPRGKTITVSPDISQAIYLQLRDLLAGLQAEMDHATAVLDETYGAHITHGLDQLNLATRRVYSNLHSPVFQGNLPYVPERTAFAADPNLLTLLVEPLYGKEPGVGVRELMQNAVDAVCELHAWCKNHSISVKSLDLPEQDSDVQIDFIQREDETWFLRVTDKGIGMTAETIQNYFLRAGASFRQSADWAKEFLDDGGKPRVLRAGRFGIGVFAVFLLGPNFRLWTRHVGTANTGGYAVEASADSQLIEIRRNTNELSIGSTIEVDISNESITRLGLDKKNYNGLMGLDSRTDWFCWDWPVVNRRVTRKADTEILPQKYSAPLRKAMPSPKWSLINQKDFDAVYWTFENYPNLMCNGLIIDDSSPIPKEDFYWPNTNRLKAPKIAIFDSGANLALTTQRYALSDQTLPFIEELRRDVIFSFIAHSLVCAPTTQNAAFTHGKSSHPQAVDEDKEGVWNHWCSSSNAVIPSDPWLYSLLKIETCFVFGEGGFQKTKLNWQNIFTSLQSHENKAFISWNDGNFNDNFDDFSSLIRLTTYFTKLANNGFGFLNQHAVSIQILVSWHRTEGCVIGVDHLQEQNNWHEIERNSSNPRQYFSYQIGEESSGHTLECLLEPINKSCYETGKYSDDILYVAEIQIKPGNLQPETLLAIIWNECLGPKPIPFDPEARRKLIEHGRQHPELKRHIEAWEEMKRTGSKWVVGDAED